MLARGSAAQCPGAAHVLGASALPDALLAASRTLSPAEFESLLRATVLQALRPIYRSDEAFRADFREQSIKTSQSRNAKVVRYILAAREPAGVSCRCSQPPYDPKSPLALHRHDGLHLRA